MRTSCGQNFNEIRYCLQELGPQNPQKWAQLCQAPKKNSGFRKVNSRTKIIQKLKVVDPETMEQWSCLGACEILCEPFWPGPGGNLSPKLEIFRKLTDNFQGLPNFQNN